MNCVVIMIILRHISFALLNFGFRCMWETFNKPVNVEHLCIKQRTTFYRKCHVQQVSTDVEIGIVIRSRKPDSLESWSGSNECEARV